MAEDVLIPVGDQRSYYTEVLDQTNDTGWNMICRPAAGAIIPGSYFHADGNPGGMYSASYFVFVSDSWRVDWQVSFPIPEELWGYVGPCELRLGSGENGAGQWIGKECQFHIEPPRWSDGAFMLTPEECQASMSSSNPVSAGSHGDPVVFQFDEITIPNYMYDLHASCVQPNVGAGGPQPIVSQAVFIENWGVLTSTPNDISLFIDGDNLTPISQQGMMLLAQPL